MHSSTFKESLPIDFLLTRIQKECRSTFSQTRQISLRIDVAAHLGICFKTNLCGKFPQQTKEPLNWDTGPQMLNFHLGFKYSILLTSIQWHVVAQQFMGTSNLAQSWRSSSSNQKFTKFIYSILFARIHGY